MAEQQDVTGVVVYVPEEKVGEIINALSPEQRRFTRLFADTIKQPHEIWWAWEADPHNNGNWLNLRTYLQFLDMSDCELDGEYGVAIVRFAFDKRWLLCDMNMQIGEEQKVTEHINRLYRNGRMLYPQSEN